MTARERGYQRAMKTAGIDFDSRGIMRTIEKTYQPKRGKGYWDQYPWERLAAMLKAKQGFSPGG